MQYWSLAVNFCYGNASIDAPANEHFLTLMTQRVTLYNADDCSII